MLGDKFHHGKLWQEAIRLTRLSYRLTLSFPDEEKSGLSASIKKTASTIPAKVASAYALLDDAAFEKALTGVETLLQELDTYLVVSAAQKCCHKRASSKVRKQCLIVAKAIAHEKAGAQLEDSGDVSFQYHAA